MKSINDAIGYNNLHSEEQLNKLRIIQNELDIRADTTILDVGCGTGLSAMLGGKITGIDPSPDMLKQCRFPTVQARAERIPFRERSFDLIICVTALHLAKDIKAALREIQRVAKKDIVLSILRTSKNYLILSTEIEKVFNVRKMVKEEHDTIFFCQKK